ncbi:MAG: hypothetical protein ABI895_14750, partial [Deltaproteobacteria bacterium]
MPAGARRAWALVFGAALGCGSVSTPARSGSVRADGAASETHAGVLSELRGLETSRRGQTDFAHPPPEEQRFGADPYRVAALAEGRALGLLRGRGELWLYSDELELIDRALAPPRGSALAVSGHCAFVAGELQPYVQRYELGERLQPDLTIALPTIHSLRALAVGPADTLYAASDESTSLFVVQGASTAAPQVQSSVELCRAAQRLQVVGDYLIGSCLLDHALVVLELGPSGLPSGRRWRAEQDGPFWGMVAAASADGLVIAASGIEDHPLDRRIGSFGYVDSFLYVYEFRPSTGLRRRLSLDSSEQGVLTARALSLEVTRAQVTIVAQAFGSPRSLLVELSPELELSSLETRASLPGSADLVRLSDGRLLSANPLLDAFCVTEPHGEGTDVLPVASQDRRSPLEKLGEALELTSLMAPDNSSEGALSRFTCETCHFEGGVDGRTHHTGRGDILATTKPLRGLFNNRPYFSRALDPDLTQMVHNEFRAAGRVP